MYEFERSGNSFTFITASGTPYVVFFKSTNYLFEEGTPYANHTYELVLEIIDDDIKNLPIDNRVGETVAGIIKDFILSETNAVTLYICDSSDGKQLVRLRKFNMWFEKYNQGLLVKIEQELKDSSGTIFPIALFLLADNPYRGEIFVQFTEFAAKNSK